MRRNRQRPVLPFAPPFIIALYAPPGSGKTTAVKSIVRHYANHFNHIVVVCCSPSIYADYDYIPENYIYTMYSNKLIANVIDYQHSNGYPPGLLILDDCIAQIDFKSEEIRTVLTTFRHLNLSVIFCSQKIMAGSTEMRDYASFNLVFKQPNIRTMKIAAHELLDRYESWKDVQRVMNTMPKYSFILAKRGDDTPYQVCKLEPVRPYKLNY